MAETRTTAELRDFLLWARANGFRISELEMAGVSLTVDDLRIDSPGKAEPQPRTAHHAWAQQIGIDPATLDDPEDDDEARS